MMTMQGSPKPLFRKGSHASTCNEGKGTECSRKACTGPCFLPQKRGAPYNGSLMPMLAKDGSSPHTPADQPGAGAERHKKGGCCCWDFTWGRSQYYGVPLPLRPSKGHSPRKRTGSQKQSTDSQNQGTVANHGEKAPGTQTCIQDENLAKQHMQNTIQPKARAP